MLKLIYTIYIVFLLVRWNVKSCWRRGGGRRSEIFFIYITYILGITFNKLAANLLARGHYARNSCMIKLSLSISRTKTENQDDRSAWILLCFVCCLERTPSGSARPWTLAEQLQNKIESSLFFLTPSGQHLSFNFIRSARHRDIL